MTDIIHSLESFNISNEELVDVTNEFFKVTSKIAYSDIIKSNNFSLLHGTHALELLNSRLDTYLLEKSQYSIDSNLNLTDATAIISTQLKTIACWLGQNVSLSNSVLSSEYVSQILETYSKCGNLDDILKNFDQDNWNTIILKFSILLISVVKFILTLALKSQIYEDEDLNTNTMNLNWFFNLSNNDIFKLALVSNKTWLNLKNQLDDNEDNNQYFSFIKNSFEIFQTLLSVENIFQWNIPLFNFKNSKDFKTKFSNKINQLESIIEKLADIDLIDIDSLSPPENAFNLNSQIKFDNQSPPKELKIFDLDWNDCILNFNQLFGDLIDILKIFKSSNTIELTEWLNYLENKRNNNDLNEINGLHIIARILLFSLINSNNENAENKLLFNLKNFKFKDFFWIYLKEFALNNSKIDQEINNNKSRNIEILQQIDYYFETISLFWKESMLLPTLNPSRQRQFKCKELKYWNLRQSETGSLEDYFKNLSFYKSNEKYYPLTFVIIFFKLKSISELILKSIELNLYKDTREYLSVYYQLTLISFQLNQQIDNLILIVNSNNKRSNSLTYLLYLKNQNNLIYQLSIIKSKQFEILSYLGFNKLPKNLIKNSLINEELLFKLQWKSFHTISDPEMLNFKDFEERLRECKISISKSGSYEIEIKEEISISINEFTKSINICKDMMNKLDWFEELKIIKALEFEKLQDELFKSKIDTENLVKFIKSDICSDEYSISIKRLGRHVYFPGIKIIKK